MSDIGQAAVLGAVAVYTGWVAVDALRTGTISVRPRMQRQREPGLFYLVTLGYAALCLLALRVIAFGLLGW